MEKMTQKDLEILRADIESERVMIVEKEHYYALESQRDMLLEACKELLALWRDAQAKCALPQCSICTKNRTLDKKFSDIIAKAEKGD